MIYYRYNCGHLCFSPIPLPSLALRGNHYYEINVHHSHSLYIFTVYTQKLYRLILCTIILYISFSTVIFKLNISDRIFFFFWPQHVGSQFPNQELNPSPLHWKHGVLSTGPPGKPSDRILNLENLGCVQKQINPKPLTWNAESSGTT